MKLQIRIWFDGWLNRNMLHTKNILTEYIYQIVKLDLLKFLKIVYQSNLEIGQRICKNNLKGFWMLQKCYSSVMIAILTQIHTGCPWKFNRDICSTKQCSYWLESYFHQALIQYFILYTDGEISFCLSSKSSSGLFA